MVLLLDRGSRRNLELEAGEELSGAILGLIAHKFWTGTKLSSGMEKETVTTIQISNYFCYVFMIVTGIHSFARWASTLSKVYCTFLTFQGSMISESGRRIERLS